MLLKSLLKLGVKRLMLLTTIVLAVSASAFAGAHGLLSREPASDSNEGWERQSYPVGCGHFGANVFGLVGDERVQWRRTRYSENAIRHADPHYLVTDVRPGAHL